MRAAAFPGADAATAAASAALWRARATAAAAAALWQAGATVGAQQGGVAGLYRGGRAQPTGSTSHARPAAGGGVVTTTSE